MGAGMLLRADAGPEIGSGHLLRCLALAQAVRADGGHATFACARIPSGLAERLEQEGFDRLPIEEEPGSPSDAEQTLQLARELGCTSVAVDGYCFGEAFQRRLRRADLPLLVFDDYGHSAPCRADLVVNPNLGAAESLYAAREAYTRLLLGLRYVPLRREFLDAARGRDEEPGLARRVLVTMGGSDPVNVTGLVLTAVQELQGSGIEVVAVVGPANPHGEALATLAASSRIPVRLEGAAQMPRLMEWAELAVAAGGTTAWELAFLGVPSVLLAVAENQEANVAGLDAAAAAVGLGRAGAVTAADLARELARLLVDAPRRGLLRRRAQDLVDGFGAQRIVRATEGEELLLRPLRVADRELLWRWANDPEARRFSFRPEPIPWEHHCRWFEQRLAPGAGSVDAVACDWGGAPVGLVRFDVEGADATVSVNVAPERRGEGKGTRALRLAARRLFAISGVERVHAYVKEENGPSGRAFVKAGYRQVHRSARSGPPAIEFVLERGQTV